MFYIAFIQSNSRPVLINGKYKTFPKFITHNNNDELHFMETIWYFAELLGKNEFVLLWWGD